MKGKYIVFQDVVERILLFSDGTGHNTIMEKDKIISAGFFRIWYEKDVCKVACWGRSDSLGKESRGQEDARLIKISMKEEYDETKWEIV